MRLTHCVPFAALAGAVGVSAALADHGASAAKGRHVASKLEESGSLKLVQVSAFLIKLDQIPKFLSQPPQQLPNLQWAQSSD